MYLIVQNNFTKIDDWNHFTYDDREVIGEILGTYDPDAEFSTLYQHDLWDGFVPFITKDGKFLTGLLPKFEKILSEHGQSYYIEDLRENPQETLSEAEIATEMVGEYSFQKEALDIALEKKRGAFWLATNAGKSVIISGICKALDQCRVTVLSYGTALLHQTRDKIQKEIDEEVGLIYEKTLEIPKNRVNVASVSLLHGRGWYLDEQVIIFDEAHLASSNQWMAYGKLSDAFYRFSFSGTLRHGVKKEEAFGFHKYHPRDLNLMGLTGPNLKRVTNQDLIKLGVSAKPFVHLYLYKAYQTFTYDAAIQHIICAKGNYNNFVAEIAMSLEGYVLVVVQQVDHGKLLAESLDCRFVYGNTAVRDRMFLDGERRMVANKVLEMGMNIPIDHVVFAHGGKGWNEDKHSKRLLQFAGRGLRKKQEGKPNVVHFHDIMITNNAYLEEHSSERLDLWESEGFDIEVVENAIASY